MNPSNFNHTQKLAAYLEAMGISRWVRRTTPAAVVETIPPPTSTTQQHISSPPEKINTPASCPPAPTSITLTDAMPDLPTIASDTAPLPTPHANPTPTTAEKVLLPLTQGSTVSTLGWDDLQTRAQQCTACGLEQTRTQTVFGVGDKQAAWLIVGEAPGADEDAQGEPFVGRAGKLLNNMLLAMGLPRQTVYIANVLKCRPPNNRNPSVAEMAHCTPYLNRQIELIQPRIILALGSIAAQHLLDTTLSIGKLRSKRHVYANSGIPLVATYHPAYLLRRPPEKRKVWQDLQLAYTIYTENQNCS